MKEATPLAATRKVYTQLPGVPRAGMNPAAPPSSSCCSTFFRSCGSAVSQCGRATARTGYNALAMLGFCLFKTGQCLYYSTIGCTIIVISKLIALFAETPNDLYGLISENRYRKMLFFTRSIILQTASCFGSAYLSFWFSRCGLKIKECDINSSDMLLLDAGIALAFSALTISLTVARYRNKGQCQDQFAKQLTRIGAQPLQNPDQLRAGLIELQTVRQSQCSSILSYTHKAIRILLGFYTGFLYAFRSRLISACTDVSTICDPSTLFERQPFLTIAMPLGLALIIANSLKSDQLSLHNQAAEAITRTTLRGINRRLLIQQGSMPRKLKAELDPLIAQTIGLLPAQQHP